MLHRFPSLLLHAVEPGTLPHDLPPPCYSRGQPCQVSALLFLLLSWTAVSKCQHCRYGAPPEGKFTRQRTKETVLEFGAAINITAVFRFMIIIDWDHATRCSISFLLPPSTASGINTHPPSYAACRTAEPPING